MARGTWNGSPSSAYNYYFQELLEANCSALDGLWVEARFGLLDGGVRLFGGVEAADETPVARGRGAGVLWSAAGHVPDDRSDGRTTSFNLEHVHRGARDAARVGAVDHFELS